MSQISISIETETRWVSYLGQGGCVHWRKLGVTTKGYRVSSWGDKNILKLNIMMAAQLWENTKKRWIVRFKWMNCTMCKLYLNQVDMCVHKDIYQVNIYTQLEKLFYLRFETKTKPREKLGVGVGSTQYRSFYSFWRKHQNVWKLEKLNLGKMHSGKPNQRSNDVKPSKIRHWFCLKG